MSSPVLLAAEAGHEDAARVLLEGGAFTDAPDGRGVTALMRAAAEGYWNCIDLLLTFGAGKWLTCQAQVSAKQVHLHTLSVIQLAN